MCYDLEARPPLPPIRGSAADAEALTLTSADGARVPAYGARAESEAGPGVVVLPDVRGLHPFFEELALRFAEAGVHAVAIDYFARTAPDRVRGEGFEHATHVPRCRPETLNADVRAGVEHLRSEEGGAAARLYTIGFCFGGRLSLLQAAAGLGLDGVIGFYGWPVGPNRAGLPEPAELAGRFDCPVLAIWGGADEGIGPDHIGRFERALSQAAIEHRSIVYPGAPHSFFDRRTTEFANESEDAWRETLEFMRVRTG